MIPDELKATPHWVTWTNLDGRKVPSHPTNRGPWLDYETAVQESPGSLGFVFTKDDPYVGIDLDDCIERHGAGFSIKPWAADILKEAKSYAEFSPSGNGIHIICRGPQIETGVNRNGIEVYSQGRYFTMTGKALPGFSKIVDATALVERLTARERKEKAYVQVCEESKPHNYMERAMSYADSVPGAVSGQRGHDCTFSLACKMIINFGLSSDEAMQVLQAWNTKCSPAWSARELQHKVDSAVRKLNNDRSEYCSAYQEEGDDPDFSATVLANSLRRANEMPEHLYDVPGVLRGFVDWCLTQNHRRNRALALVGAIAWGAYCTGRRVQDSAGLRTNLYLVGMAPSAGGKQAPLECLKFLADAGYRPSSLVGKVTSDSAIAHQLAAEPSSLCLWDEFGLFLQKTNGKGGTLSSVQDILLELWGCTRTNWRAKKYVDGGNDVTVIQPCFSLLGMTTPDHFWSGLTRMHLRDGFAGRLLVIDSGPRAERGEVEMVPPPKELIEWTRYWTGASTGNLAEYGLGSPDVRIAKSTQGANKIFDDLLDRIDEETDDDKASIWGRSIEKARKLAMIWACAVNRENPVVDYEAASWGVELASWATESFLARVDTQVVGEAGDSHSRVTREVISEMQKNGKATKKDLLRRIGGSASLLGNVLDTLVQAGLLTQQTSGKTQTFYLR